MTKPVTHHWYDNDGEDATTTLYFDDGATEADMAEVRDALKATSNAALLVESVTYDDEEATPGTPDIGPYAVRREGLALEMRSTETGDKIVWRVPAPDEAIIGADDETPINTDADMDGIPDVIQAAITAIEANACDAHGFPVKFGRAYRTKTSFYK